MLETKRAHVKKSSPRRFSALPAVVQASVFLLVLLVGTLLLWGCAAEKTEEYTSEGDYLAPIDIGDATSMGLQHKGETGGGVPSYYKVLVGPYTLISLTGLSGDADLVVYSMEGFISNSAICASVKSDTNTEQCTIINMLSPTATLYILVKSMEETGAQFSLNAAPTDPPELP
ncbi:MAG: hypothetical protein OEZ59_12440 [Deltaproteobacteria bacterium]|nr:hypothetical protein [Deltaproteobacteria bacterium]